MNTLPEINTTKKKTKRRSIIGGLFGGYGSRQSQEEEERQLQMEHSLARTVEELQAQLNMSRTLGHETTEAATRIISTLKQLKEQEANGDSELARVLNAIGNDAEEIMAMARQLTSDAEGLEEGASPLPQPAQTTRRPLMVMAVGDPHTMRQLTTAWGGSCDIVACGSHWEAMAQIMAAEPDIVVADVQSELINGLELCRRLKAIPKTWLTPIVMVASNEQQHTAAMRQGAEACITKPFNTDIVRWQVMNIISAQQRRHHRMEQERWAQSMQEDTEDLASRKKLMMRVKDFIRKNLDDSGLSIEMIAEEVGVSRSHLHRKMKESMGMTPHEYIRQARMERAMQLLGRDDTNITEVAYSCGFANSVSFSISFKKMYGITPSEYTVKKRGTAVSR